MLRFLLVAAACLLLMPNRALHAADASSLFADGERAFAAMDYGGALKLFMAAREAGSTGPSSYYNIGVCQYLLRDYGAAEATFADLSEQFPAMRELAEYNRGLALRAAGETARARIAFERARAAADSKIVALANAQLAEIGGGAPSRDQPRWGGYLSGGVGYDDNVALVDDVGLAGGSSSSPMLEAIGLVTRNFVIPSLRVDATGYWVRYADADEFDQTALRLALVSAHVLGEWTLAIGPTLGRSTLDGDGLEEAVGADLRLRRSFGSDFSFDARLTWDDIDAGDVRFAYLAGSRRQVRLAVQHAGRGRVRVGYDLERADRADPGVSASRQRWSVSYLWPLSSAWTTTAALAHRTSRYDDASVPREERLLELSFAARRELSIGWTLSADYRWSDNDSTVDFYSYDGQRVALGLSRSF
jgi:tetratricopeptide (TPR) repeat protein